MARATITKRFELSEAAVAELERRVTASGAKSQTAYVEDWLTTLVGIATGYDIALVDTSNAVVHNNSLADSTPKEKEARQQRDAAGMANVSPLHERLAAAVPGAVAQLGESLTGLVTDVADMVVGKPVQQRGSIAGAAIGGSRKSTKLCEHNVQPANCKHCRGK